MDWRAWTSGGIAGISLSIMGHPFDTIKTRMQTNPNHRSALACAVTMGRREGVLSLWQGLTPSVIAGVMTGSLRFGVQSWANQTLAQSMGVRNFVELKMSARVLSEACGGWVAGMVLPLLFTPLEMIKCRQQVSGASSRVNSSSTRSPSPSTFNIMRDVLHKEGVRCLYVGHVMTTLRSTFGNAALFGSYVIAKDSLSNLFNHDSFLIQPLSGILAGWCSWIVCYPVDAVKSRMQVEERGGGGGGGGQQQHRLTSMRGMKAHHALRQLWREGGMYRGIGPVLIRAIPVHMAYLPVFDLVSSLLRKEEAEGE